MKSREKNGQGLYTRNVFEWQNKCVKSQFYIDLLKQFELIGRNELLMQFFATETLFKTFACIILKHYEDSNSIVKNNSSISRNRDGINVKYHISIWFINSQTLSVNSKWTVYFFFLVCHETHITSYININNISRCIHSRPSQKPPHSVTTQSNCSSFA